MPLLAAQMQLNRMLEELDYRFAILESLQSPVGIAGSLV